MFGPFSSQSHSCNVCITPPTTDTPTWHFLLSIWQRMERHVASIVGSAVSFRYVASILTSSCPFMDFPFLRDSCSKRKKLIKMYLSKLHTQRAWSAPPFPLDTKMAYYQDHFLHLSSDGFVVWPSLMNTHLSHGLRCIIGQILTSSHQQIETGRFEGIPALDRICHLSP